VKGIQRRLLRRSSSAREMTWMVSLIAGLIVGSHGYSAGFDRYEYRRWLGPDTLVVEVPYGNSREGTIVVGGDSNIRSKICDVESGFHCFFGSNFVFGVPRGRPLERRWEIDGVRFQVVQDGVSISVFGQNYDNLVLIKSRGMDPENRALLTFLWVGSV